MPVFLAPLYLLGALTAAAPLLLHLLHRRNPRPVLFSTLRFLQTAIAKNRRSRRVTQILILLMRVLILLLIALAFARPVIRHAAWLPRGQRTLLIVLDASASMRTRHEAGTRFTAVKNRVGKLLDSLDHGDSAAVLAPGSREPVVVLPALSDHRRIKEALDKVECGYGQSNLTESLAHALRKLNYGADQAGFEIHLFSDWQAETWGSERARELADKLAGKNVPVFISLLAGSKVKNAGLVEARFYPPAIVGQDVVSLEVFVAATPGFAENNTLSVNMAGEEVTARTFKMQPAGRQKLRLVVPVGSTGQSNQALTGILELSADALAIDNRYHFSLPQAQAIPVVLVNGTSGTGGRKRDTFFLHNAIEPGARANTLLVPKHTSWKEFLAGDVARNIPLVLISNPPGLPPAAIARIETYLAQGGHVYIFPGNAGQAAEGMADLPDAEQLRITAETFDEFRALKILPGNTPSHIARKVQSVIPGSLTLNLQKRLRLQNVPDSARVTFQYGEGTPFMLSIPHQQGMLHLATVSANRDWSDWPMTPFFVVTVQEMLKEAVRQGLQPLTIAVGNVLSMTWTEKVKEADFRLQTPNGNTETFAVTRKDSERPFLFEGFEIPGFYRLERGEISHPIAVNVPPAESSWEYLGDNRLKASMPGVQVYTADNWAAHLEQIQNVRRGRPLWPWLLTAVLLLTILEELVANLQSRARSMPTGLAHLLQSEEGDQ